MSFTTVLVHVEGEPWPDPRLALAIDVANQFEARLLGVGAELYRSLYSGGNPYGGDLYGDVSSGAAYRIAAERESVEADLKRAGEKFLSVAGQVRAGSE